MQALFYINDKLESRLEVYTYYIDPHYFAGCNSRSFELSVIGSSYFNKLNLNDLTKIEISDKHKIIYDISNPVLVSCSVDSANLSYYIFDGLAESVDHDDPFYYYPYEDDDSMDTNRTESVYQKEDPPKCECGASAIGSQSHSTWCKLYKG